MEGAAVKRLRWQVQHALRAVGLPGWVGAVIALACAAVWWGASVPLADDAARLAADSVTLERRLAERQTAAPIDATPQQQLEAFTRRFPDEKGIAPSLARLHAIARRRGVTIERAEFKYVSEASEPLARYTVVLPVKADYRALRRFSRDLLRELPGVALEEVNLRRSDAKAPVLEAQLRLVLFLSKAS